MEGGLGGAYYYDPREHALVHLSGGRGVRPELYDPFVNQPIFESSAFALFLVADMDAIEPAYGRESPRYVAVEAGLICQALEVSAPDFGLGLCQVGDLEFDQVAKDFLLGDRHRFVHSLLGGLLPPEDRSTG